MLTKTIHPWRSSAPDSGGTLAAFSATCWIPSVFSLLQAPPYEKNAHF